MSYLRELWASWVPLLRSTAESIIADSDQMLVTALLVIVLTGLAGGMIVRKLRQPLILGYILAGVLVGIFFKAGFGAAANAALDSLANIGVALLLFAMGLEFSRRDLAPIKGIAVWGTLAQVAFTLIGATLIAWKLDFATGLAPAWPARIVFGTAFVSTSTAVVLKTLTGKGVAGALSGRVMIGMSIVQDLTVIPLMLLAIKLGDFSSGAGAALRQLAVGGLGMALILFAGSRLLPRILRTAARQSVRELYLLAALAIALGVGYAGQWLNLSFSFGAFLAGIALSESPYGKKALYELVPVRDLFAMLFFVSIGMMLDVGYLVRHFVLVMMLVLATALSRTVILSGVTWFAGYRNVIPVAMLFGMVPTSEMAFVVGRTALDGGFIGHPMYSLILCVTVCSMIVGPAADSLTSPVYALLCRTVWKNRRRGDISMPPPDLSGHVVISGGEQIGRSIAHLMKKWNRPYVLVEPEYREYQRAHEEGLLAVYGDLRQEVIQHAAGIAHARILLTAGADTESNLAVISAARKLRPELAIVTRADTPTDVNRLREFHPYEIVQPKFEAALEMSRQALLSMKTPVTSVQNSLDEIRFAHYRQTAEDELAAGQLVNSLRSFIGLVELYWAVIPEGSPTVGRTLAEADLRRRTGMSVVGVLRDGVFTGNPAADYRLKALDTVAAIGDAESRRRFEELLNTQTAETAAAAIRQMRSDE